MSRRGSLGAAYAIALAAGMALLLAAAVVGTLLEGRARARGAAEAAVHAALSARDWAAAQACGCPRLNVPEALHRADDILAEAMAGRDAAWWVAINPSGEVQVTVTLTVPTFLGWLGLPPQVGLVGEAGGRLEWWADP